MLFSLVSVLASIASIAQAATLNVTVSGPGPLLAYVPNQLNASAGDVVQFTFVYGNHSVTQSASASMPCMPLAGGFNSGYEFVGNSTNYLTYNLTINNTDPIYIHCQQGNHCSKGMVMGINVSPSNFTAFQAAANATAANSTMSGNSTGNSSTMTMSGSASGTGSSATTTASKAAAFQLVSSAGMVASVAGFFAIAL